MQNEKCVEVYSPHVYGGFTADEQYEREYPTSQHAFNEANLEGLQVILPKDNELQLDLDTEEDFQKFINLQDIVQRHFGLTCVQVEPSRSGLPKRHVTLTTMNKWTNTERILMQACLGSDRTRELLSFVQEVNGDPHPTLFLENPPQYNTDIVLDGDIPY